MVEENRKLTATKNADLKKSVGPIPDVVIKSVKDLLEGLGEQVDKNAGLQRFKEAFDAIIVPAPVFNKSTRSE